MAGSRNPKYQPFPVAVSIYFNLSRDLAQFEGVAPLQISCAHFSNLPAESPACCPRIVRAHASAASAGTGADSFRPRLDGRGGRENRLPSIMQTVACREIIAAIPTPVVERAVAVDHLALDFFPDV